MRFSHRARPILSSIELCREVAGVQVGELSVPAVRSALRRYSDACIATAKRTRARQTARHPRRREAGRVLGEVAVGIEPTYGALQAPA